MARVGPLWASSGQPAVWQYCQYWSGLECRLQDTWAPTGPAAARQRQRQSLPQRGAATADGEGGARSCLCLPGEHSPLLKPIIAASPSRSCVLCLFFIKRDRTVVGGEEGSGGGNAKHSLDLDLVGGAAAHAARAARGDKAHLLAGRRVARARAGHAEVLVVAATVRVCAGGADARRRERPRWAGAAGCARQEGRPPQFFPPLSTRALCSTHGPPGSWPRRAPWATHCAWRGTCGTRARP